MNAPALRWPNLVIRASAGTGKTYQLSNRYLQLAADGQPADQVLASTFARKAAGEILGRVLVRLAGAAVDAAARAELARAIGRELSAADCQRLLGKLIGDLHRLRIGTLDSFFVQVAGHFTLELGLPGGWRILDELDDEQLRLEALRQVLSRETTAELTALVQLLFKGDAVRSVTRQLAEIVAELYGTFCESGPAPWQALKRPPVLRPEELDQALEALAGAPPPAEGRVVKAWAADVGRAQAQDWEGFITTGLAAKLLGDGLFYKKPIDPQLAGLYEPLLRHARGVIVGTLVSHTEATYKLLAAYADAYQRLKLARRGLCFDDIPRLLATGLADGLMQHADWRLDASIGHLLLDEFQDTSLPQWQVLKPFALASCDGSAGRSFFCVGDVKQAIYRWRGGVAQLFDAVCDELPGVGQTTLAKSFRSSQPVIDAVNRVFTDLRPNGALAAFGEVAQQWREAFEPHSTAKLDLAGYVTLAAAPEAPEGHKQLDTTLEYAAERVATLAREYPGRTIGVLTRRNKTVAQLIHLLRSKHKLPASQEGGNPLTDSAAVQLVMSLCKLADHPGDLAARFHVAHSPLGPGIGLDSHADGSAAARLAALLRRRLLDDGYGRTIYAWIGPLSAHCGQRDVDRLRQLVELGYAFDRRGAVRPSQFVSFVERTKVEDPSAAVIRVMTVHQAKGLQFDVVVLPELEGRLKGNPPKVAIGRERPTSPIERVCRHAAQHVCALLPVEYQETFEIWPREAVNESLCLLYVAMTRAVHALHMIVPPTSPSEKTFPQTLTGVLRAALIEGRPLAAETVAYEHGDSQWFRRDESPAAPAPSEGEGFESIALGLAPAKPVGRQWNRRSPSSLEGAGKERLDRRLSPAGQQIFARGTLWHAWLETIEWLESNAPGSNARGSEVAGSDASGAPAEARLRTIARTLGHQQDLDTEIAQFRGALEQADIRRLFSRQAYADPRQLGFGPAACTELGQGPIELVVERERRFAVRDAAGLLSGSFDRLVLLVRSGRVLAADILDFKTDRVSLPDEVARQVQFYQPQLAAYRSAASQLYRLPPDRVISRLAFVTSGIVRAVT